VAQHHEGHLFPSAFIMTRSALYPLDHHGMPLLKELTKNVLVVRKEIQGRINNINFNNLLLPSYLPSSSRLPSSSYLLFASRLVSTPVPVNVSKPSKPSSPLFHSLSASHSLSSSEIFLWNSTNSGFWSSYFISSSNSLLYRFTNTRYCSSRL